MTFAKLKNKIPFFKLWNGLRYIKHPWEKYILITIKEEVAKVKLKYFIVRFINISSSFSNRISESSTTLSYYHEI